MQRAMAKHSDIEEGHIHQWTLKDLGAVPSSYCWWLKSGGNAPVEVGSLSHYLQGFVHPKGGWEWDFWTINSITNWEVVLLATCFKTSWVWVPVPPFYRAILPRMPSWVAQPQKTRQDWAPAPRNGKGEVAPRPLLIVQDPKNPKANAARQKKTWLKKNTRKTWAFAFFFCIPRSLPTSWICFRWFFLRILPW